MTQVIQPWMSYKQIAMAIYLEFSLHQSIDILGLIECDDGSGDLIEKGSAVMQYITYLYTVDNFDKYGNRKFKYVRNSNGAPVAHKLFKFNNTYVNNMPKWTIWRAQ